MRNLYVRLPATESQSNESLTDCLANTIFRLFCNSLTDSIGISNDGKYPLRLSHRVHSEQSRFLILDFEDESLPVQIMTNILIESILIHMIQIILEAYIMPKAGTRVFFAHVPVLLAEKVDQLADRLERSRSWIIKQALLAWIAQEEERDRLKQEALADVDNGHFIDHQAIQAWADSRDDEEPLAVPRS